MGFGVQKRKRKKKKEVQDDSKVLNVQLEERWCCLRKYKNLGRADFGGKTSNPIFGHA